MKLDFYVSHNYTQRDLLLLGRRRRSRPPPPPPPQPPPPSSSSLYTCIYIVFSELRRIILEQFFFCQRLCKQGSNLPFHSIDSQVIQYPHNENTDVIDYLEYYKTYPKTLQVKTIIEIYYMKIKWRERARKRYTRTSQRAPKGTSDRACALPYFPGEALWMTSFPIKRPHQGGYCTTSGRSRALRSLPVAMVLLLLSEKKRETIGHAHAITSVKSNQISFI